LSLPPRQPTIDRGLSTAWTGTAGGTVLAGTPRFRTRTTIDRGPGGLSALFSLAYRAFFGGSPSDTLAACGDDLPASSL